MTTKTTDQPTGTASQPQKRDVEHPDPVVAAQTLRDSLRETLQSTTTLIRSPQADEGSRIDIAVAQATSSD